MVFKEDELQRISVGANFATTASDGKTYGDDYYNLDVTISVECRISFRHFSFGVVLCTQRALSGQYRCITLIYQVNLTLLNPLGFKKNKFCIFIMINKL